MEIKLTFLGAAQNVTGSRYLMNADGTNILVDCGLYQERQFLSRNWDPFPFPPKDIQAVFLTHAHLDHCGLLPKLVKEGFSGPIYCTEATADIAKIILLDSAKLQEEDAAHKRKRHAKEGRAGPYPEVPLYMTKDAEACFQYFEPVDYCKTIQPTDNIGIEAALYDAGHVLGSSIIRVKVRQNGDERIILFTGDMGRPDKPIVCDPKAFDRADYVLIESTYGDRVHDDSSDIEKQIGIVFNATRKAGGNVVIPSFALERSQEVLYYINELLVKKTIKPIKIFLDSPMAAKITDVFKKHVKLCDPETRGLIEEHASFLEMQNLIFTATTEESKEINDIKKPVIIIAGSGMCTGGRIKHHLIHNITRPESTIMFVGYQAEGTLGRQIIDGEKEVRIMGQLYPVRAKIERIIGFSAHADKNELLSWLKNIKLAPREIFAVHGELQSTKAFAAFVSNSTGWHVTIPQYMQQFILK